MSDIPLKHCSHCPEGQQWHPATTEFFHRNKANKDGLESRCKLCKTASMKAYRARPEVQEREKTYRVNPEVKVQQSAWHKVHYLETRERQLAYMQDYLHRPGVREQRNTYNKAHYRRPDVQRRVIAKNTPEKRRKEYLRNKDKYLVRKNVCRARKKNISGTHSATQIREMLKRQKYRCYYAACGHARFERVKGKYIYHIDHTFPLSRVAGTDIPANDISYLVLACPTCNLSKNNKYPWEFPEGGRLL